MVSTILALSVFCWILIAGVQTNFDSSPTQFFNIDGNRSFRRSNQQTLNPAERDFMLNDSLVMNHVLALMSKDLLEKLEIENQKGNREDQIRLQDSYVHLGNGEFLLSKLKWGENALDIASDLMHSSHSCLRDFGEHLTVLDSQRILFTINFTHRLSVYGEAKQIEEDVNHKPSISVPSNSPIRVTNEPLKSDTANSQIGVSSEPPAEVPVNPPIEITREQPTSVPANSPNEVTQEPSTSKPEKVDNWIGVPTKFAIFVENAQLNVEYIRVATFHLGIVSEVISEEVNFEKLSVKNEILEKQGLLVDQQMKKVEDEMFLLQKLADSWMVSLINTINNRYIKPNMWELSRPLLQKHKNKALNQIGVIILQSLTNNSFLWQGKPLETADKLLTRYPIDQLELRDFRQFINFIPFSASHVVQENGTCSFNEIYCHTLIFDYYMTPIDLTRFSLPTITWQYIEPVESVKPQRRSKITKDLTYYTVTGFSIKLTINTDKLGRAISTQVETHMPMNNEAEHNRRELHLYLAAILQTVEKLISERVKEKFEFSL